MDNLIEFLTTKKTGYTLTVILGFIIPGLVLVFVWDRELFMELDALKLMLIAFGIMFMLYLPSAIFCAMTIMLYERIKKKEISTEPIVLFGMPVGFNIVIILFLIVCKILNNDCSIINILVKWGVPFIALFVFELVCLEVLDTITWLKKQFHEIFW